MYCTKKNSTQFVRSPFSLPLTLFQSYMTRMKQDNSSPIHMFLLGAPAPVFLRCISSSASWQKSDCSAYWYVPISPATASHAFVVTWSFNFVTPQFMLTHSATGSASSKIDYEILLTVLTSSNVVKGVLLQQGLYANRYVIVIPGQFRKMRLEKEERLKDTYTSSMT
jgi:hypothetical protein